MKLPEVKPLDQVTTEDVKSMADVIPHICSYLGACVTGEDEEGESFIQIQVVAGCGNRRWAMDLALPYTAVKDLEPIEGDKIPSPSTVLENLTDREFIHDGEVIARTEVSDESDEIDTDRGADYDIPIS